MSKAISVAYLLDRFSWFFHQMEGICVNFLDPVQFFWFLKGRCQGNQISGKNGAKLATPWKLSCNSAKIGLYCQISQQLQNQCLPMFQRL